LVNGLHVYAAFFLFMKTTFTILFIVNTVATILLTYLTLYEIEHSALKIIITIFITLTAVSIFTLFRLYFKYISRPAKSNNLHNKKGRSLN
jgi:hypothetical protein